MRTTIWAVGITALTLALLSSVLRPFTGELNAALLPAAVVVGFILIVVDILRGQDELEIDQLLVRARLVYVTALAWPISQIAHLILQIPPGQPAWLSKVGYEVVLMMIALAMPGVVHLLCRLSFNAAEIRTADRRTFERLQGLTFMEKVLEQLWGGPGSRR
jgi:hypothetical protein